MTLFTNVILKPISQLMEKQCKKISSGRSRIHIRENLIFSFALLFPAIFKESYFFLVKFSRNQVSLH